MLSSAAEQMFQSPFPVRGTTSVLLFIEERSDVSIPVPREGNDFAAVTILGTEHSFQSLFPVRGTTVERYGTKSGIGVSIPVPREGNDDDWRLPDSVSRVSIPVPREGNDCNSLVFMAFAFLVSIPVPREGNDK